MKQVERLVLVEAFDEAEGIPPKEEAAGGAHLPRAKRIDLSASEGVVITAVGIAEGDNAQIVAGSKLLSEILLHRDRPISRMTAEARQEESDSHQRPRKANNCRYGQGKASR